MEFFGMITSWDFLLFLLGAVGITFFKWLHKKISECDPGIFAIISMIIVYLIIMYIKQHP